MMKFCIGIEVSDMISHVNFGDRRFRSFGIVSIEFSTFPLAYIVLGSVCRSASAALQSSYSGKVDKMSS